MKKLVGIWCLLLLITGTFWVQSVQAEDEEEDNSSKDIMLVYPLEGVQFVSLAMAVEGKGAVIDGTQEIRDGINLYDIRTDEEKVFTVHPDPGNEVASISINGQEMSTFTKDIITISGAKEDTQVKVLFDRKEEQAVFLPTEATNKIYTGDDHNRQALWMFLIIDGIFILFVLIRYRRKKT